MLSDLQEHIGDLADNHLLVTTSIDLANDAKAVRFAEQVLLAHYWLAIDSNLRQAYGEDAYYATWEFLIDENVKLVNLVVSDKDNREIAAQNLTVWEYPDIDVEFLHCYRVSSWFADKKTLVKGV